MNSVEDEKIKSLFLNSKICKTCDKIISGNEFDEIKKHQELNHELIDDNRTGSEVLCDATRSISQKIIPIFAYNPNILSEIQKDLEKAHVGDNKSKVLATILLASSKRKGHEQAIIIQKQSSAGGSNLQDSILHYFDNKLTFTRMTGAYIDRSKIDYNGKILAIGEMSGFDSASASLRQKLSEGKTELATTDRDDKGRIITDVLRTEGRPCLITTTTSLEIHPEFENRCWILGIDETSNQTKSVNKHQFAKDTFEYEEWKPNSEIKELFNSGILEDLHVVNPFSEILGENFPSDNVTARRDSKRFADLVTTITFIYQHQRVKIKTKNQTFILVSYDDLKFALYYGHVALKNTLNKLNEKSESVIEYMKANKDTEFFTRIDLCNALKIPYETMKRILIKLVDRSFVEVMEVDRIWKYKLSNKVVVEGISIGREDDYEKIALEYLQRHATNFEEIIVPPNYINMTGVDKSIVDSLLSLGKVVTDQNGNRVGMELMPVTTLPSLRVTGMDCSQNNMPITGKLDDVTNDV